ncbi:hypothetical protein [Streptosporangium canum]|nr:hypothetical protein [Streptosporangium canum]
MTALAGAGLLLTASVVTAPGAQAEVWDCHVSYDSEEASAWCNGGYGTYRVKANCASPRYPYNITIYGPTKSKLRDQDYGPFSSVAASDYNCNITSATYQIF